MYSNGGLANKMLPQPMVLVNSYNDIGLQLVQHRPMLVLLSINHSDHHLWSLKTADLLSRPPLNTTHCNDHPGFLTVICESATV